MNIINSRALRGLLACVLLMLAACAHNQPATLYQWGSYQDQVYLHFKGESTEQQILALEKDLLQIQASDKPVPPGLQAHMAMLYAEAGNTAKAQESLLAEKARYPESTTYVDLLLKNLQN